MEKSTRIARLALFAIIILFLFPVTSCTTDSESDLIYERSATTNSAETDPNKGEEEEEKDLIDKRKIRKSNKKNG
ncbi:MAG: hypothetical protein KJP14_08555 [Eudoraea sp.]|nr:hypothetical protein [Eudoraea sp.]MBT8210566.1 hypothetical protein [Eudoraea sp.]NNK29650.1 hypothetical protein [Flavobacteriaceae bacterium]